MNCSFDFLMFCLPAFFLLGAFGNWKLIVEYPVPAAGSRPCPEGQACWKPALPTSWQGLILAGFTGSIRAADSAFAGQALIEKGAS